MVGLFQIEGSSRRQIMSSSVHMLEVQTTLAKHVSVARHYCRASFLSSKLGTAGLSRLSNRQQAM